MIRSGFILRSFRPVLIQFNGLQELSILLISSPCGAGPSEYWVLPGNRKEGYWSVKVTSWTLLPRAANSAASRSLKAAIPPL